MDEPKKQVHRKGRKGITKGKKPHAQKPPKTPVNPSPDADNPSETEIPSPKQKKPSQKGKKPVKGSSKKINKRGRKPKVKQPPVMKGDPRETANSPLYECLKEFNLDIRQSNFVVIYCGNGFNGTRAYMSAGYTVKDEDVASSCSSTLLRNPKIRGAVRAYLQDLLDQHKGLLEKQLFEVLFAQAFYDPEMFYNVDGTAAFKSWKEVPKEYRCCVESLEEKWYGKNADTKVIILKLVDRKWALDKLDKYVGMTKERTETTVNFNIPVEKQKLIADILAAGDEGAPNER